MAVEHIKMFHLFSLPVTIVSFNRLQMFEFVFIFFAATLISNHRYICKLSQ